MGRDITYSVTVTVIKHIENDGYTFMRHGAEAREQKISLDSFRQGQLNGRQLPVGLLHSLHLAKKQIEEILADADYTPPEL